MVQGLLQEFSLSSDEGVALMCLAEALLRVPDAETIDALAQSHCVDLSSIFAVGHSLGASFVNDLVAATLTKDGETVRLERLGGHARLGVLGRGRHPASHPDSGRLPQAVLPLR